MDQTHAPLLDAMIGQVVVVDMASTYVCLGTLAAYDRDFLELRRRRHARLPRQQRRTARPTSSTRSASASAATAQGARARDKMVAITRFADISES